MKPNKSKPDVVGWEIPNVEDWNLNTNRKLLDKIFGPGGLAETKPELFDDFHMRMMAAGGLSKAARRRRQ
jgi:hypothetical protein